MMTKYGNKKTVVDGITFDSKAEARRWGALVILERMGHIGNLTRQVSYVLAPKVHLLGDKRAKPAMKYVADFAYTSLGVMVVEDVKGVLTPLFRAKQHLMKTVHGIDVVVVR